jgi:hypothetical protein
MKHLRNWKRVVNPMVLVCYIIHVPNKVMYMYLLQSWTWKCDTSLYIIGLFAKSLKTLNAHYISRHHTKFHIQFHTKKYGRNIYKRNVAIKQTRLKINLLKSDISLPSLICRGVGDLRKPHCGSYASDPIYNPMQIAIVRPWQYY